MKCAEIFEDAYKLIAENEPRLLAVFEPRHYVPATGYFHPKYHAASSAGQVLVGMGNETINKSQADCILVAWGLAEHGVPLYTVAEPFLQDLVLTDPPENLVLAELHWPHEAMTFMLPLRWGESYFGWPVAWVSVARQPAGIHSAPECISRIIRQRDIGIDPRGSPRSAFVCSATVLFKETALEYSASWEMDSTVAQFFQTAEFFDNTQLDFPDKLTAQQDQILTDKLWSLAIHLLFALDQLPEQTEPALCVRPMKEKKHGSIVRPALYQPPWLGRRYVQQRVSLGGTHASPHLHPRRGHWRNQAKGPGRTLHEFIWIKPMMVGGKTNQEKGKL